MEIAQVIDGKVIRVGHYRTFEGLSKVPTAEEMTANGYVQCNRYRPYNEDTQILVECDPILEGNWVYLVAVHDLSPEELAANNALRAEKVAIEESRRKTDIKVEARARILEIMPEWKQANYTARAVELTFIKTCRDLTDSEKAEWAAMSALWERVREIRAYSGELESDASIVAVWPE